MDKQARLAAIRARTRRRFGFSIVALVLYFAFALAWTDIGRFLSEPVGDGPMNWALLMFISLILIFIAMEFLFLFISNREQRAAGGSQE